MRNFKSTRLEAIHVGALPKGDETPDKEISTFADEQNLILVTKDFDFYHSHMTVGKQAKLFDHHRQLKEPSTF